VLGVRVRVRVRFRVRVRVRVRVLADLKFFTKFAQNHAKQVNHNNFIAQNGRFEVGGALVFDLNQFYQNRMYW
jgi:hypothetical protein